MTRLRRWLHEPLLHFLLIGALLFAVAAWRARRAPAADAPAADGAVRVGADDLRWMRETWARQWQRPPTDDELRGVLADYLRESLLAREAVALGLDQNDTVIRRRLAQKMEFLVQDTAQMLTPDAAALAAFFESRRERYRVPGRVTFTQVFFRKEAAARAALDATLAAEGGAGANLAADAGDPSLLAREHAEVADADLDSQFGPGFGAAVAELPAGHWQGPVPSAFGFHLVRVASRAPARDPTLDEVRERVVADWVDEAQAKAMGAFLAGLQRTYTVQFLDEAQTLMGPVATNLWDAGLAIPLDGSGGSGGYE